MQSLHRAVALSSVLLAVVPATVAGQPGAAAESAQLPPTVQALVGFVSTLLLGGLLLALAPEFVDRGVERIHDEGVACFGWGVFVLVAFVGVSVLLAVTVVGIVLVIPLALGFFVVAVVGNALGYLALFDGFVESRRVALVAGAVVAGVTNLIPILGGLVGFVVGSLGVGAVVRDYRA
jgi:hypothetical protein